jgi:hypothetical protein
MNIYDEVFAQHGYDPVAGQPGLYKSRETGKIGNIRDHCPDHFTFYCQVEGCQWNRGKPEDDLYNKVRFTASGEPYFVK